MKLLSFLHLPDITSLENISNEIKELVYPHRSKLTFYGYSINEEMDECFQSLLYGKYYKLHTLLKLRMDEHARFNRVHSDHFTHYNGPFRYVLWKGMTLLEVAYLLHDQYAIHLLEFHQRTICHTISSYQSKFGIQAIQLALQSREKEVAKMIWNNIHVGTREYFKQLEPGLLADLDIFG